MLYTYPHYYRKFQCIASECEDTCCAGWEIMIDDKALEKYKKAKGPVGNRLKNSINWKEGSFLQYHHRCAFLNDENLCDLYTEMGPDSLCRTCRMYPRHVEEFEGSREYSLCPVSYTHLDVYKRQVQNGRTDQQPDILISFRTGAGRTADGFPFMDRRG